MWWRVAIAFALIVIIICGGLILYFNVSNLCTDISNTIRHIKNSVELGGSLNIPMLEGAYKYWMSHAQILASFVVHDRIDTTTAAFERALAFGETETPDEYLAALREIMLHIELLRMYDLPCLRSIF